MFFRRTSRPAPALSLALSAVRIEFSNSDEESKKILVVDDDPVILKTLSFTLRTNGYQVVTATDGAEAINQVKQERPDLLIVDVFLAADPQGCGALGWDAFQVSRWVRNLNCQAPVIIISGSDQPEYRQQTIAAGARGFLTKPIDSLLLLNAIGSLLSEKKPVS